MARNRKAIVVSPQDDQILRDLYREFRIPSDQYKRRPNELQRFVDNWNSLTNRSDTAGELLHYIVTQRKKKAKKWPTFGDDYQRMREVPDDFLTSEQWKHLGAIYCEIVVPLEIGTDNLAYDDCLAAQLSREFHTRTGRTVLGRLLFAAIMAKRKRGEWVKVRPEKKEAEGIGFSDINKVAG